MSLIFLELEIMLNASVHLHIAESKLVKKLELLEVSGEKNDF